MKHLVISLLMVAVTLCSFGATVPIRVSGLEESAMATVSIASYSYLETMTISANGDYTFYDVPDGTHYVKIEANGYEVSPAQAVKVAEGDVSPLGPIKLVVTRQTGNEDEWSFRWEEDGSPSGYTYTSHVNKPAEIEFLGKKIVPADVPSFTLLERNYHIYLDNEEEEWTQEYAYRILETLKTLPVEYGYRKYASFRLTDSHIADDIEVVDKGEGYEVLISKDAFYYANPFLVSLDGVKGRLFSKRLHHALTNFVTDFGKDDVAANTILERRFGCQILNVDYEALTKGITDETETHFQLFLPSELVAIINMFEELPEGFHVSQNLRYLIRRINGMPHPLYANAAAVAWPVENGYIEFMESAFGGNNEDFETLRLILHEKTHFLWAFTFPDEIKNDWIKVGGWYEDPNAKDGWSTTKDVEFVSAYAHAINPGEDMAESVAFYLKNPEKLMSRAPEKYEFIRDRIMHGTRYISKIPDHLTFEVLNLYPDYDYPGKIKSIKVNVSGKPEEDKEVTVEIALNDEEGYDDSASSALMRIFSPSFVSEDGTPGSQYNDIRMLPVDDSGHVDSGHVLRGSIVMSKYSKGGHWTAGDIVVNDTQGNQRFEGRNDCVFDLYLNSPLEDTAPPKYEGDLRYILTDSVCEGHKIQNLQVRFRISDNVGFQRVLCRLQLPGSTYSRDYDGYYDAEIGEGIVDIPITEYFRSGDYYISLVSLYDLANNNTWFTFSRDENDYPIQYIHITTENEDVNHPEIDLQRMAVYAEPTHPEAPDGETLVTISFYARDDKSGLGTCNYRLRDPQGVDHFEYFYHRNFYNQFFDGDPTLWEHYLIKVILPKGSAPGIWGLSQMTMADKAFNEYTYNFVETLLFEPEDDFSDYELFADIVDHTLSFGLNSVSGSSFGFRWRIIHEVSGMELSGEYDPALRTYSSAPVDANHVNAYLGGMPAGDLILLVNVIGEDSDVVSVKSQRINYAGLETNVGSSHCDYEGQNIQILAQNGCLVITGAGCNEDVVVYGVDGCLVYSGTQTRILLPDGLYIVKVGNTVKKIKI